MSRIRYMCKFCKCMTDIKFDAWAYWDEETQQMELYSTFDGNYCSNCEESNSAEKVIIKE